MIFRGTFEHSLDAKHRLTVPAKFRGAMADGVVLAISPGAEPDAPKSLAMWTPAAFDAYAEAALADLNPLSPTAQNLQQVLYANSHDTELDSANRVMIPPTLMAYAGLERELIVAGVGQYLKIWDRGTYHAYNEAAIGRFAEIAASLDHTA